MKLIKKKKLTNPVLTLREFHEKRNKVLFIRELGGLGDILMHRMMFEDFKKTNPDLHIIFACPKQYHPALQNHPYIDEILDSRQINTYDYIISYNSTTACTRYEIRVAPFSGEHRSDIWAGHCGVHPKYHDMHLAISEEDKKWGQKTIRKVREGHKGSSVLLCPISAMRGKNLTEKHMIELTKNLRKMGHFVCASHNHDIPCLRKLNVPIFSDTSIPQWMGVVNAADYVISVDTAAFHLAGGLDKPLTGIFTFADGKVYGKYFDFILVQKHRDNGDWDCGPCYNWANCPKSKKLPKPCLSEISTEMIMDGVKKMFHKWPNHNEDNSIKLTWNKSK